MYKSESKFDAGPSHMSRFFVYADLRNSALPDKE